jgi:dipeptidyl-peptidase-3
MKNIFFMAMVISTAFLFSCKDTPKSEPEVVVTEVEAEDFNYLVEQFADLKILRYQIPSWDNLTIGILPYTSGT